MSRALGLIAVCAVMLAQSIASADPTAAKEAYDRASEAFARKSYTEAAASFALADRLEPNPVALEAALKAVVLADDPVLGMELVERAASRPPNAKVDGYVKQARAAFESRAGKLAVTCADERGCTVQLNGVVLELGKRHWVRTGPQRLNVTVDGVSTVHTIEIKAGAVVDFAAPAPPRLEKKPPPPPGPAVIPPNADVAPVPTPKQPDAASSGLHPAIFGVTVGLFAVAGGITIWSGVDALDLNDQYLAGDDAARDRGMAAQDRTNAMIGVTAGGALAATLLAIFTDWSGSSTSTSTAGAPIRLRVRSGQRVEIAF